MLQILKSETSSGVIDNILFVGFIHIYFVGGGFKNITVFFFSSFSFCVSVSHLWCFLGDHALNSTALVQNARCKTGLVPKGLT